MEIKQSLPLQECKKIPIRSITIIDFSKLNQEELEFQIEQRINVSAEPENIIISMRVHLMNDAEEIAMQGVRAIFKVKPFNSFVNDMQEDDLKVSNPALIDTFISVCIGAIVVCL